jgi:hypothetical protein
MCVICKDRRRPVTRPQNSIVNARRIESTFPSPSAIPMSVDGVCAQLLAGKRTGLCIGLYIHYIHNPVIPLCTCILYGHEKFFFTNKKSDIKNETKKWNSFPLFFPGRREKNPPKKSCQKCWAYKVQTERKSLSLVYKSQSSNAQVLFFHTWILICCSWERF